MAGRFSSEEKSGTVTSEQEFKTCELIREFHNNNYIIDPDFPKKIGMTKQFEEIQNLMEVNLFSKFESSSDYAYTDNHKGEKSFKFTFSGNNLSSFEIGRYGCKNNAITQETEECLKNKLKSFTAGIAVRLGLGVNNLKKVSLSFFEDKDTKGRDGLLPHQDKFIGRSSLNNERANIPPELDYDILLFTVLEKEGHCKNKNPVNIGIIDCDYDSKFCTACGDLERNPDLAQEMFNNATLKKELNDEKKAGYAIFQKPYIDQNGNRKELLHYRTDRTECTDEFRRLSLVIRILLFNSKLEFLVL